MKFSEKVPYMFLSAFAVLVATSAYPVYKNTMSGFPIGASYFWFVSFAFLGSLLLPKQLTDVKEKGLMALYPEMPGKSWLRSVRKIGTWRMGLNAVLYTTYFSILLSNIRNPQPSVIITILVLGQIKPILGAYLGFRFLHDTCKSWTAYVIGACVAIAGVFLYRYQQLLTAHIAILDPVALLMFVSITAETVRGIFDAHMRRTKKIPQTDAVMSVMAGASVIGCVWMFAEAGFGVPQLPTFHQLLVLIYLGVMPTAIGLIFANTARDKLGFQVSELMSNMRPLFALLYGTIPLAWFALKQEPLHLVHYIGLILTIVGVAIVLFFAKGEAKT